MYKVEFGLKRVRNRLFTEIEVTHSMRSSNLITKHDTTSFKNLWQRILLINITFQKDLK